jgi:amidase
MTPPRCPSARAAAREIAAGRLSCAALVASCLDASAGREAVLGAWQHLDAEQALEAARRLDAQGPRGPLHGIPIAVKDLIDTADMPTSYGSAIYEGHRPAADAACVALARASGALVLGKTVTTEFACFSPGRTTNPHNAAHTPGGSSSGSAAAIGAGIVPLAFGTQTAGSVIRPAAFCGCVGYKPSFGTIPRAGVKALCDSLDTVGVFAQSVDDAAFFAGIVAGRAALRDLAPPASPPQFGFCRTTLWDRAEPATRTALAAARAALEEAGARIVDIILPPEYAAMTAAQETVMGFELVRALADERRRHAARLSPRLAELLDSGTTVTPDEYDAARARRDAAQAGLDTVFAGCAALLVPAAPGEAPAGLAYTGDPVFNRMWTLLGVPCVAVPAGTGPSGLPLAVQLVGRRGADVGLMQAALFLERALAEAVP